MAVTPRVPSVSVYLDAPFLRAWRARQGIEQSQLAARARVGVATLSRLECGGRGRPTSLYRIASALGLSVAALRSVDPLAEPPQEPMTASAA